MIDNLPVKKLEYNNLTIEGYSRAAVQTYWRFPELKIGFDLGAQPWSFMGTATWFVSHGHLDHIAAIPVYVARRRMMKMDPPTIYLPESLISPVKLIFQQFTQMDRGRLPCDLVAASPGDEIELSREHVVTVVETKHSVPSLGFIVWERRKKLKSQYQSLTGEEIRRLRLAGQEVSEEKRRPLLAYLGDSAPEGLDHSPEMFEAEILITELTFLSPHHRRQKIHKFGHLHLDDIVERRERFKNKLIIASHFSTRYHENTILNLVEKKLPDMLDGRLHLWL
ncbi:MAG: MBL fold metallo-hydrolase [Pirellulales bacterium]|nr:MBL fold metallo-hydrolase [Pirellulales bacterium]